MVLLIFGLGSAGLPLRLQYARSGIRVLGLDLAAKNFPRYRRSQPHPAFSSS
jgi:UDP-N-acetyl-D-mannosaminuronate dehydrogenase